MLYGRLSLQGSAPTTTFNILRASGLSGAFGLVGVSDASELSGASAAHCYMPSAPNPRLFWL